MGDSGEMRLRRGWTTGACATAATRAACEALAGRGFPDPVEITLPRGQRVGFALALEERGDGWARAGVVKDAGDDPDVTHGALVTATVRSAAAGSGVTFSAGEGVGTVTRPGLPIAVGEPAINPVPREMMRAAVAEAAREHGAPADVTIEIAVPGGTALAERTWNPRLGIVGGISILGTTGVVIPYSCSAWIHSIRQGIDVARAADLPHAAACTGRTSERAVRARYHLPDHALLDMGDFAGGLLKYLREHPLPRLTIAGGFAKLAKLAAGRLDLHSKRGGVDLEWLANEARALGADETTASAIAGASGAGAALLACDEAAVPIAAHVAARARETALGVLRGAPVEIEVLVIDRDARVIGAADG